MADNSAARAGGAGRVHRGARTTALALLLVSGLSLGACSSVNPLNWFDDDEPLPPPTPAGSANTPAATSDRFPNLGRVPPRPVEITSEGERRKALDNLAADRENARHTDQELRARPADSNTPPPAPRPPVTPMPGPSADPGPQPAQTRQQLTPAPAAPQPVQMAQQSANGQPTGAQQPVTLQPPAPTAPAQNRAPAASAGVVDTYSQSLAQSSARTLPPNLAQVTMQPSSAAAAPGGMAAAGLPGERTLLAVVRFGNGETSLGSDDRNLIRRVADYYKGVGKGSIAVLGFASSRTSDMEPSAHRQLYYRLAQKRAEAVAAELRRRGVAAARTRTEARADAAPVYYEAMPRAEDYNRRVEIYLVN